MADTIDQVVLKSGLPAFIELFELDCTNIPEVGLVYYLTAMVENSTTKVSFGNQDYNPWPLAIDGVEQAADGAPARPTIALANVKKLFGTLAFQFEDLVGCSLTYIRTFETYLNSANRFSAAPLKFTVAKKLSHNASGLSWELRSQTDRERAYLPGRQMLKRDFPGLGINKYIQ